MGLLDLTLACAPYDLTLPLYYGRVKPQGINLNTLLLRYEEFDAAETLLSAYLVSKTQGPDLVAIPVFPTRVFRHSSIFINRNAGIAGPSDLKG